MNKYYLYVLGCAMNYSDAERIASIFDLAGYVPTKNEADANIVVVLACSVRQKAIDRILGKVKGWDKRRRKEENFKTILSGCVLPEDRARLSKSFDLIFEISEIQLLAEFINPKTQITNSNLIRNSKLEIPNSGEYLNILPKYNSPFRAFVPIMTGCDNFCSYCAVPYTRGREKSRPEAEILQEVTELIGKGYKEITLLGQNVNSYEPSLASEKAGATLQRTDLCKDDKGPSFVSLLRKIDKIPGDYRIYFYSNHPKDFSDELIWGLPKLKHFPPYIHLPLQSGNDEILRKMNRNYTSKHYLELIRRLKSSVDSLRLTTDIIVGFPTETKKQFENTYNLCKQINFAGAYISQFSPRAGTPAAKKPDNVTSVEKKRRWLKLNKLINNQNNK